MHRIRHQGKEGNEGSQYISAWRAALTKMPITRWRILEDKVTMEGCIKDLT